MSILGTGVAAAVAQTVQQAQAVARQRDKQETDTDADAHNVRDLFDSHLKSLEESAREQSATHLHVDGELPEHQSPDQRNPKRSKSQGSGQPESEAVVLQTNDLPPMTPLPGPPGPSPAAASPDAPLYRHLDLQA